MSKSQIKRQLYSTKAKFHRMEFAGKAVADAKEQVGSTSQPLGSSQTVPNEQQEADWVNLLPSFPPRDPSKIPKRGHLRQKLRRANAPIFTTEGVTVKWHHVLDAEFADDWPTNVQHQRMGWTRYTAPPGSEIVDEEQDNSISAFKASQWRNRSANWVPPMGEEDAESKEARLETERRELEASQRKEFVEGVKSDIVRKVREKELARREQAIEEALRASGNLSSAGESRSVA